MRGKSPAVKCIGSRAWRVLPVACAALLAAGCAAPVKVKRISPRDAQAESTSNVLTTGELSDKTQTVLRRHNLQELAADDPVAASQRLRSDYLAGSGDRDELIALGELSYFLGDEQSSKPEYLAAAAYAYAFLFPGEASQRLSPVDPRVRFAADLYGRALVQAFRGDHGDVVLGSGAYPVPFGVVDVQFDEADLDWGDRRLVDLMPSAELEVYGLRNRYRQPGIGAAVAAATESPEPPRENDFVGPQVRVPGSIVLSMDNAAEQVRRDHLQARLDFYNGRKTQQIVLNGMEVPLELEPTAALASSVAESRLWETELAAFLGDLLEVRKPAKLFAGSPHQPGRIPVVFVHGTASSPMRWADMVNDLQADPFVREHYEFWFFTYDSGNPIAYSSMLLRRELTRAVQEFDPEGKDACLRDMVVIGHSQGGLLTKMTAVDTGDKLWANVSSKPFDEVKLSAESRELLSDALFVKPLPFVKRVIFVATPHGGSYLAGPQFVQRLASWAVSLPKNFAGLTTDLVGISDGTGAYMKLQRLPTSIDNMSPSNPFIKTLATVPVAPEVPSHSIIGNDGDGPNVDGGDGVVLFKSAHIEGVESEYVVHCAHSMQSHPEVINEVDRILRLHVAAHPECAAQSPE